MAMFMDDTGTNFSLDAIDTPHSRRVESSVVVDLRGSPRIEVTFPAEIARPGKPAFLAMITNISRTGLRAEGCRQMIDSLFGGEVRLEDHNSVVARYRIELFDAEGNEKIVVVTGRTVYARPDNGRYQVGVQFLDFEQGREDLFEYLASKGILK